MHLVGEVIWSVLVSSFKEADVSSALNDGEVDPVSGVSLVVFWHWFGWLEWILSLVVVFNEGFEHPPCWRVDVSNHSAVSVGLDHQ